MLLYQIRWQSHGAEPLDTYVFPEELEDKVASVLKLRPRWMSTDELHIADSVVQRAGQKVKARSKA
jgi:hypothetical protein